MVDARLAANRVDGSSDWLRSARAGSRFMGWNESWALLYDSSAGTGFDGLEAEGVNRSAIKAWRTAFTPVEA